MFTLRRKVGAFLFFAATLACATRRTAESAEAAPSVDRNVLTREQVLADRNDFVPVKAGREVIEQDHLRFVDQSAGECQFLLHAAG